MTSGGDELFVTVGGRDVGLGDILRKVDAEMQHSADQAVRLGQQYARLAQAQGQPALASQVLAGTIQNAGAASEKALIGIETQAARVGQGATYFQQFGSAAVSNLTAIAGPAAAATVAIEALKGSFDLAQASSKIDATRESFDHLAVSVNTTGDALLDKMRAAAQGTVSDANLIQSANSGILLTQGKLAADLPRILEISRAAAQATGDDVNFIFNSLVTGIARGSPKIIDNAKITLDAGAAMETYAQSIGKTVDQLSAADQQQATLNAVLAAGTKLIQDAGPATDSNTAAFARAGVTIENAKNALGSFIAGGLRPYADSISQIGERTGQFLSFIEGIPSALFPTAEAANADAAALAAFDAEMQRSGDTAQAEAAYQAAYAAALQQTGQASQAAAAQTSFHADRTKDDIAATSASAQAMVDEAQKKLDSAAAAQQLAQFQATLANLGGAVAGGMQTAGSAAAALASQYHIAYAAALQLINAQAQLSGGDRAAARTADFSERHGGEAGGALTPAQQARAAAEQRLNAQIASAARDADAQTARNAQTLAVGTHAQKLALLQQEYDTAVRQSGAASAAAIDAQTKLFQEQQAGARGGGTKLSDQQKLNNSLLADQDSFNDKYEDAELQHAVAVKKIYDDFATKMREAERDFNQEQLDSRAGFYDQLGQIESGKIQKAASAQYEAAAIEAGKIAQEKGADVAEKYMQAQEQIISARAKRLAAIEQAEKDKDKSKAEYLRGVDAEYKKAEDAKLARIKEGDGSLASERDKQIADEGAKYEEAQGKIAESADRAAERKIAAAERAGKKIDEEGLKVDTLTGKYDRLGVAGSRAGITPGPAGAAATAPAAPAAASTAAARTTEGPSLADLIGQLMIKLDEVKGAIVDAEKGGADQVSGAIRNLRGAVS